MCASLIKTLFAEAPSQLTILWRSGKQTKVNVAEYLDTPGYEKLREAAFFVSAVVEEWGHGVEWADDGIGIDADSLYRLGKEQSGAADTNTRVTSQPSLTNTTPRQSSCQ